MVESRGILNRFIDKLPIEWHIPNYQYCGPGTKLERRLAREDAGINLLDSACKNHDIAYSQNKDKKIGILQIKFSLKKPGKEQYQTILVLVKKLQLSR